MNKQNFETAAVCGLFCKSCGIYIATQTNNEINYVVGMSANVLIAVILHHPHLLLIILIFWLLKGKT